jgi:hypothetical protein
MVDEGAEYGRCGFGSSSIAVLTKALAPFGDYLHKLGCDRNGMRSKVEEARDAGNPRRAVPAKITSDLVSLCHLIQDALRDDPALSTAAVRACGWAEEMAVLSLSLLKQAASLFSDTLVRFAVTQDVKHDGSREHTRSHSPITPRQLLDAVHGNHAFSTPQTVEKAWCAVPQSWEGPLLIPLLLPFSFVCSYSFLLFAHYSFVY